MKTLLTLILSSFLFSSVVNATVCTSLSSGAWSNPLTWSCGAVPSAGDTIIIATGHTVNISVNTNMSGAATTIIINGTLLFDSPGAKLRLGCGSSVAINLGGQIASTGVGFPSHSIKICDVEVYSGTKTPLTGPIVLTGPSPLPVELVYFTVENNDYTLDFEWKTASENNNDYFVIEGSVDGSVWIELDSYDGAGNSLEDIVYNEQIDNRANGHVYFRLSQVDIDGAVKVYDAIAIEINSSLDFNVYPNPINQGALKINVQNVKVFDLSIVSLAGLVVYEKQAVSERETWINDFNVIQVFI